MWPFRRTAWTSSDVLASDIIARLQRLEREQTHLRAQVEGDRRLRNLAAGISEAAQAIQAIGLSINRFGAAMRRPIPRGRVGGLARARTAWRYSDGTFMPESVKDEARLA